MVATLWIAVGAALTRCLALIPAAVGRMWFWFLGRADCPWYPRTTLYRQHQHGDWTRPLETVAQELRRMARRAA